MTSRARAAAFVVILLRLTLRRVSAETVDIHIRAGVRKIGARAG